MPSIRALAGDVALAALLCASEVAGQVAGRAREAALRGGSGGDSLPALGSVAAPATPASRVLAGSGLQDCGQPPVARFSFANNCGRDIHLKGWDVVIPARSASNITSLKTDDIQRISWKFVDGAWDYDYIEMNTDWAGAGTPLCGHPNYATWYGFSMSSKYEALDPVDGSLACADAGAAVNYKGSSCPSKASSRYDCDFNATMASIMDCDSKFAVYQQRHSWAINQNGSFTPAYACAAGARGEWCGNIVNYWCAPESANWLRWRVGSLIDCTSRLKAIHLRVTACLD